MSLSELHILSPVCGLPGKHNPKSIDEHGSQRDVIAGDSVAEVQFLNGCRCAVKTGS